jgi:hypothetical protein
VCSVRQPPNKQNRYTHSILTLSSRDTHARLKGHPCSAQETLTLMLCSRCAQGALTLNLRYTHAQLKGHTLKLRSQSAQGTLTLSSMYTHARLKVQSRPAQGTLTLSSSDSHAQVMLTLYSRNIQTRVKAVAYRRDFGGSNPPPPRNSEAGPNSEIRGK